MAREIGEERRQEYLISFLRGCAHAADEGQLQVEQDRLLINGDLMHEAADEFEKLLGKKKPFKSSSEELQFNLLRAEQYARQAHDLLYTTGLMRSVWFKMALGRAQSIIMSLYNQEMRRKEK